MTKADLLEIAIALKFRLVIENSGNVVGSYYVSFAEKTIYAKMVSPTQTSLPLWGNFIKGDT